jgi:hypothetical protein
MAENTAPLNPSEIDPLQYLQGVNGQHSPAERHEHYLILKPALFRLRRESPVAFKLALKAVEQSLQIAPFDLQAELQAMTPPAPREPDEPTPLDVLKHMKRFRPLHFPQAFVDGKLWFGLIAQEAKLVIPRKFLLNSDRELLPPDQLPEDLQLRDRGCDDCRFSKEGILRFLSGDTLPDPSLLTDLGSFFARFSVFRDRRVYRLLGTWTLGTYCYQIFRVYPYLGLRSPDKRCGKSRVLSTLSLVAFNASPRVVFPTEAQLFRRPSRNGGTLLLDEVEALGRASQDLYTGLLAVLNSGFEQGGSVQRLEKDKHGLSSTLSIHAA